MDKIEKVYNLLVEENKSIETVREIIGKDFDSYEVYPDSIFYEGGSYFFIAIFENSKKLIILNRSELSEEFFGFETEFEKGFAKICDLNNGNSEVLRKAFPFTKPSNHHGTDVTIGLGDRLGMASVGHIRLFKGREAFPVLAQQSDRKSVV